MKKNVLMPLIMAVCVIVGILIGTFCANHFAGDRLQIINSGSSRLTNLLHVIDDQYVDAVDIDSLVDRSIPQILSELDPHSVYIPASEATQASDELKGSFSGIGIEFNIREDTIRVQNVIANGPSERAGLLAGDKIVSVDGKTFVGKDVTNEKAIKTLKGPEGSKIKVGVLRYGSKKEHIYEITRGNVVQHSITSTYMLNEETGYIKIRNFGENTFAEFLSSLAFLSQSNAKSLVIDLRDNTGGLLQAVVLMANEFLERDQLIVYTQGRKVAREDFRADGRGSYKNIPLVVLTNEISASASEIFAGAIQDNDRGTIIGRRSFGKGLVQQQIGFSDGSLLRLTVARYYTPSGRCIQKPYEPGKGAQYEEDLLQRYQNGEIYSADSIHNNGKAFKTSIGRTVYDGGGITPDIFVPEDTTSMTSYYKEAAMSGLILQYAFNYTDRNRNALKKYKDSESLDKYLKTLPLVEEFADFAESKGMQRRNLMIQKSHTLFERYIHSRIIYNMLNDNALMQYLNQDDKAIEEALRVFENGTSRPTLKTSFFLPCPADFRDNILYSGSCMC
ncbi:MAG: S41 family peptidase [Bacteroidaceae bacterium]|nr:S41 family peptidase [Bacteroidaceae bacterium]